MLSQLPPTGRASLSDGGNTVLIVLQNLGGAMLLCRGCLGGTWSPQGFQCDPPDAAGAVQSEIDWSGEFTILPRRAFRIDLPN